MYGPVLKSRWSFKYSQCVVCGTKKKKHKGRGLCMNCHNKEMNKKPSRKSKKKIYDKTYYNKVKGTLKFKERNRKRDKVWKNITNPRSHRKNWQKRNFRISIRRFLLSNAGNKTGKGLIITIDGKKVKTNIKPRPAVIVRSENDDTMWRVKIFKQIYRKLKL